MDHQYHKRPTGALPPVPGALEAPPPVYDPTYGQPPLPAPSLPGGPMAQGPPMGPQVPSMGQPQQPGLVPAQQPGLEQPPMSTPLFGPAPGPPPPPGLPGAAPAPGLEVPGLMQLLKGGR